MVSVIPVVCMRALRLRTYASFIRFMRDNYMGMSGCGRGVVCGYVTWPKGVDIKLRIRSPARGTAIVNRVD